MKKLLTLLAFVLLVFPTFGQLNIDSLSHINFQQSHNTYLNDVWGFADEFGNEYAVVGARKGVSIVDVSNPSNPNEIFWIDGEESIWRNSNTFNKHSYTTTEAESGLLILDMSSLPDASGINSIYYTGPIGNEWQSAHTIFIDSAGYAYVFGANRGNGGVIILDIHTDPMHPIEVGTFDEWYVHDGYVVGDTMYCAHIYEGFFSIVDISDRANPILINSHATPNTFSHNVWTSPDKKYLFSTDEVSGAFVASFDISDPTNIIDLDKIQSSPGSGVIPHNVHYNNGYLVTAFYSDGVVVFDAHRPENLVQVANYDTYPGQTTSYDGNWATYSYLPSGIILANDISEGFFVLDPTYMRASYLEGIVTDQSNSNPLSNVKVSFTSQNFDEFSKLNGDYKTGLLGEGNFEVTFFKVGYFPQTFTVPMTAGFVNILNVALVPIPQFNFTVTVKDANTNSPILGAHVNLKGSLTENELTTNGFGSATFSLFYQEAYNLTVGNWGHRSYCQEINIDNTSGTITVLLDNGYQDDFTFDLGWTTSSVLATQGFWERGKPNATSSNSAPGIDSQEDCGDKAFVTGNNPNLDPDFDEVKKGQVNLFSTIFDLSNTNTKFLHYERWFYNFYGPFTPYDDTLKIYISNGDSTVLLDVQGSDEATFYVWNKISFFLPDYIGLNANMQLIIRTSDLDPEKNITEAGFDNFYMDSIDHFALSVPTFVKKNLKIYPNPVNSQLIIENAPLNSTYFLINLQGKIVLNGQITDIQKESLDFQYLNAGIYFLQLDNQVHKIIKQ